LDVGLIVSLVYTASKPLKILERCFDTFRKYNWLSISHIKRIVEIQKVKKDKIKDKIRSTWGLSETAPLSALHISKH